MALLLLLACLLASIASGTMGKQSVGELPTHGSETLTGSSTVCELAPPNAALAGSADVPFTMDGRGGGVSRSALPFAWWLLLS